MPDTVKVPLLGTHKKGTVIGVAIGGVAVSAYMIYHYRKQQAAQQAAASSTAQTAYGYSAYGYGLSRAAAMYGYGMRNPYGYGYYGYGEGQYGYGGFGEGGGGGIYGYGGGQGGGGGTPQPTAITTNAEWGAAAITALKSDGFNEEKTAEALGAYELGRPVTPAQRTIIQAAIGVEGEPPQAGKDDYPPKIRGGGHNGGGQGGGGVTVPHTAGKLYPQAAKMITAAGLKPERADSGIGLVSHTDPAGGSKVKKGTTVKVFTGKGRKKG